MTNTVRNLVEKWNSVGDFSGVISVSVLEDNIYRQTFGCRNRAEELPNREDTAFAIASGTKLFTALCVCQLIDRGLLSMESRVCDLIGHDTGSINKDVTVLHLLTHTSGIGDYIDEEASSDYFDILKLYDHRPVHRWDSLVFYLPMFNELPQKFAPGERFGYSNAGFILLGLVIEAVSGMSYHQFVEQNLIAPLGLSHTGFYRMNNLPGNAALGYVYNEGRGEWETNVLYMPIVGGSDGGLFTCAADVDKVWRAILDHSILSKAMTEQFFAPRVAMSPKEHVGLGVFMREQVGKRAYYSVGGDFGVTYTSAYFPKTGIIAAALGNTEKSVDLLFLQLLDLLG